MTWSMLAWGRFGTTEALAISCAARSSGCVALVLEHNYKLLMLTSCSKRVVFGIAYIERHKKNSLITIIASLP
jgi:hypothetical protein